jgi:LAO/AO transport system kinase
MRSRRVGLDGLVEGIRAREWRSLGRGLSMLEDAAPEAAELVRQLYPSTGRAFAIGITGPPGSGKSTLVRGLARSYRESGRTVGREAGRPVGIVAVDPTSPFTGGALLGDRVRMQDLATDRDIFIRSMATRGAMGGLAPSTRDAVDLLDAAGFDPILVETVGVGQDEVDVMRTVDAVVVVTVPGLGDEIQAIKAGIMEIADVFVVNKADRPGVERAVRDLMFALELAEESRRSTPIVKTVASRDQGIAELRERVDDFRRKLEASDELARRRFSHLRLRVESLLERRILEAAHRTLDVEAELRAAVERKEDPWSVAGRIFERVMAGRNF